MNERGNRKDNSASELRGTLLGKRGMVRTSEKMGSIESATKVGRGKERREIMSGNCGVAFLSTG
jgi:hypothetical protein